MASTAKAEAAKLRANLSADAEAELREHGGAVTWRSDLATVSAKVSHETVYVADEKAFTDWVALRYGTEVEAVVKVREAWAKAFLANARPSGEVACDPGSGEIVPGLAVRAGGQFGGISILPTSDARAVFAAVAHKALRVAAVEAGPGVPVVLAEIGEGA